MTLLSLLFKASLLLTIAAAAHVLLTRRTSAATRHLVLTLAVVALLLLPLLSAALPSWAALPLPERVATVLRVDDRAPAAAMPAAAAPTASGSTASGDTALVETALIRTGTASPAASPLARTVTGPVATIATLQWTGVAAIVYWAGLLIVLARLIAERLTVRRVERRAADVIDPEWRTLLAESMAGAGVRRPVRLLRADADLMPMATGLTRASIVLPPAADAWSVDKRRAVLLHELAHVARHDCLTQLLAAVACAVYWVHPGAWWLARRLRVERELACDDRVIAAGTDAGAYAGHLLDLAYTLGGRQAPALAVSMANRRQLEGRLLAAMDAARNRATPALRGRLLGCVVLALLVVPIASATAVATAPALAVTLESASDVVVAPAPAARTIGDSPALHQTTPLPGQVPQLPVLPRAESAEWRRTAWRGGDLRWSAPLQPGQRVRVAGIYGPIRAARSSDQRVYIEARRAVGDPVTIEAGRDVEGFSVCVDTCGSRNSRGRRSRAEEMPIEFLVRVPDGVRFSGATVDGDVDVDLLRAPIDVASIDGDVHVRKSEGFAVSATTVDGDVDIEVVEGDGAAVGMTTISGNVRSDFLLAGSRLRPGRWFARTRGPIPPAAPAPPEPPSAAAAPLPTQPPAPPTPPGPPLSPAAPAPPGWFNRLFNGTPAPPAPPVGPVSATIGNGGPPIRVTTIGGNITIRRR